MTDIVDLAFLVFLRLAGIPVLNRPVVTRDPAVNLGCTAADRADILLTRDITVVFANRIRRGQCIIRQFIILGNLAD